jgi:hypothetical protein
LDEIFIDGLAFEILFYVSGPIRPVYKEPADIPLCSTYRMGPFSGARLIDAERQAFA